METKKIVATVLITGLLPLLAMAQATTIPDLDVITVINNIVNWLFGILLVLAVLFFILAAFKFITAGGNPEEVESARRMILYGVIGLIVAFLARGIVQFVNDVVGG